MQSAGVENVVSRVKLGVGPEMNQLIGDPLIEYPLDQKSALMSGTSKSSTNPASGSQRARSF